MFCSSVGESSQGQSFVVPKGISLSFPPTLTPLLVPSLWTLPSSLSFAYKCTLGGRGEGGREGGGEEGREGEKVEWREMGG